MLTARLDRLRQAQNPDGGWGFHPGKQSWLEPTFYSSLALHGEAAADRAWELVRQWQGADGAWRPSSKVDLPGWGTALGVTLACIRGEHGDPLKKGVAWLLRTEGNEANLMVRALTAVGLYEPERDLEQRGWPWKEAAASWVEPTAHALVALKKAAAVAPSSRLTDRVRLGEGKLLDVQCTDGGWNYGSRVVLHEYLPSWPETTALGLFGLQGRGGLAKSLDLAQRSLAESTSPLARAWISIALRLHGRTVEDNAEPVESPDIAITALQALAAEEGNCRLLAVAEVQA